MVSSGLLGLLTLPVCWGADQVLLTRHCVRSMYPTLRGRGDPAFDFADNYTARPFPTVEWQADAVAHCTVAGSKLAFDFGASLRSLGLSEPTVVVADNISRCVQTAEQIAAGHGGASYAGVIHALDPVHNKLCATNPPENRSKGAASMIELAEQGGSYLAETWNAREALKSELQALVGCGAAPPISDLPDHFDAAGNYVGGMHVASQGMIENFLLEAGAGLPVAWGALDGANRSLLWQRFSPLNVLYNQINHNSVASASRDGAVVLRILEELRAPGGSLILVGHDTNVDNVAALLGLRWQCGPFAENESPPHIGLLFQRRGEDHVDVTITCTALDGTYSQLPGEVLTGELKRGDAKVSTLDINKTLDDVWAKLNFWGGVGCASAPISPSVSVLV